MNGFRSYLSSLPVAGRNFGLSLVPLTLSALALLLSGCGAGEAGVDPQSRNVNGTVHGGQQPVTGAVLQMYAVGTTGDASNATPLFSALVTTSDGSGNLSNSNANVGNQLNRLPAGSFTITGDYTCPSPNAEVYLVATGGNPGLGGNKTNPALAMMAVLGRCGDLAADTYISLNELTTVGSLAPLTPYMNTLSTLGSGAGDASQFLVALDIVRSYTNTANGVVPGPALQAGYYASSLELTTLADILANCINSDGTTICQQLFTLATPPGGAAPTDTITATLNILKFPTNNVAAIFNLLTPSAPFQPTLSTAPNSWALPIIPITATPVISPATGSYALVPTVTLTDGTLGATIYYTVDGSAPTTSSSIYSAPFKLASSAALSQTVRAIALMPNSVLSAGATARYTIPPAGTTTNLVFIQQPVTTQIGAVLPNFRTGFVDSYGNTVRNGYAGVYLTLQNNPTSATLGGSAAVSANSSGFADFNSITVDKIGTGYTLLASWYGNGSGPATALSAPFDITQAGIVLATPSPLIGNGSTQPGTFTLGKPAPAGGVTVNFVSSNPTAITVSPTSVALNAGDTTGAFSYTAAGTGVATLRASATGYLDGTVDETTTASFVSLGTLPAFALGGSQPLTLTLSTPAPTGGITVNLTSNNPAVASIAPATVVFPGGATTTTTSPVVAAKTYGTTQLLASATSYAPDAKNVALSGSATMTATLAMLPSRSITDTITLIAPAPTGGVTFTIASDKPTIAYTSPTSVLIPAGATSVSFTVYSSTVGSTTIRANAPGFAELTTAVSVNGTLILGSSYASQPAAKLYVPNVITLSNAPAAALSVTLTSSNPSVLLLSTDPNVTGSASITVSTSTTTTPVFYEQGQALGNVNITLSATNFTTLVAPVAVNQPTLLLQSLISNNTLTSTAPSGEIDVALGEAASNGSFLGICAFGSSVGSNSPLGCKLNPGVSLTVDVTSSNAAVGTITSSPVTLSAGSQLAITRFQPVGAGTTNVALGTLPAGLYTSAAYPFYTFSPIAVAVTQPTFTLPNTGAATRTGITTLYAVSLSSTDTRTGGAPVTVTVGDGSIASLSTNASVLGGTSITIPNTTLALPTIYLQGLSAGQTSLTFTSPGYKTTTTTLYVSAASIIFTDSYSLSGYPTDLPQQIEVGLPCATGTCFLNPGVTNQFTLTSSNPAVAAFANPVTLPAGAAKVYATLNVLSGGTTTLGIGSVPAPLVTPSTAYGTISRSGSFSNATLTVQPATTGVSLYVAGSVSVNTTPANPTTLTLTSSNPSVAVVSTNAAAVGSATAIFPNFKSGALPYYIQGLTLGTSTLTISGVGYTSGTATISVLPTGIVFSSNVPLSTTAFASASPLTLYLAVLDPTTGAARQFCSPGYCALNPGASVSATVTSSNLNTGTAVTSPITFVAGSSATASTSFLPNDIGSTVLTINQPAGFTASAAGLSNLAINVSGDTLTLNPVSVGVGIQSKIGLALPTTPPKPISITVSLVDPALGRLSLDPNVLGTGSSLTFNNVTAASAYSTTGGPPFLYVQGTASGYTQLTITAKGYNSARVTVAVNKVGMTVHPPVGSSYLLAATNATNINLPTSLSMLDPFSASWLSDCIPGLSDCLTNPGFSAGITLATADAGIGTFPGTPTAYNSTATYTNVPFTPAGAGFTNYTLAAPPAGLTNTTTLNHAQGLVSVYANGQDSAHTLFIAAHDVDAGVGIQVLGQYSLSGTVFNYNSTPFSITVADPTVALVSATGTTTGSATFTRTGPEYVDIDFYIQGLKAGTTTITIAGAGYTSRTLTVNVRPAGFTIRQRDVSATPKPATGAYYGPLVTVRPALLDAQGQWLADAQLNPQSSTISVAVSSANTAVGNVLQPSITFTGSATQATFEFDGVAVGATTLSLGTVTAPFIQATTYQTINATVR